MPTDLHPVNVICDEGTAFLHRHPELNDTHKSVGGLLYGFLRAVAECPDCPGVFRVSPDGWQTLVCRQCGGVWTYIPQRFDDPTPPAVRAPKKGRRRAH